MNYKAALCSKEASSSCNSHRSRAVERAPKGLHFPKNTVPDNVSDDPYYVFILTNVKTFDELYGSKCESRSENKKFVIHSLRLFKEPVCSPPEYDKEVDYLYSEDFEKISPGLSYVTGLDHRKHQYEQHGYLLGLSQEEYFDNMIKLYNHFDFNAKLRDITNYLHKTKRGVPISKHEWNIVDTDIHDGKLRLQLYNCNPGICYAVDKDGKKFVYEYKFYLNKNFEIVNAPDDLKVECLPKRFKPVYGKYDYEILKNEMA